MLFRSNASPRSLNEMLEAGELDAFIGTNTPACYKTGVVKRLLPDFHEREKDYFRRTGIHPIMHLVAIKREIYEKNPWIAPSLYRAFNDAKNDAWSHLTHSGAHVSMLPFIYYNVMEARETMGEDPWPYGVEG